MTEETSNAEPKMNCPTDKNYVDIIKSDLSVDKQFISETGVPAKILYYCRNCKKPVTPKRIGKKLSFKCEECGQEPVAFGTETSIKNYFDVK